jgi:hypothetical protein
MVKAMVGMATVTASAADMAKAAIAAEVAATKTKAAIAMAGGTDNNQLKGA